MSTNNTLKVVGVPDVAEAPQNADFPQRSAVRQADFESNLEEWPLEKGGALAAIGASALSAERRMRDAQGREDANAEQMMRDVEEAFKHGTPIFGEPPNCLRDLLLKCLKGEGLIADEKAELGDAHQSCQGVWPQLARTMMVGSHGRQKKLKQLSAKFTRAELLMLSRLVTSTNLSYDLSVPMNLGLVTKLIGKGLGEDLFAFINVARDAKGRRSFPDVVDDNAVAACQLWTDPDLPLWLLPSKVVVAVLAKETRKRPMTTEAFDVLARRRKLRRLSTLVGKLFSKSRSGQDEEILGPLAARISAL